MQRDIAADNNYEFYFSPPPFLRRRSLSFEFNQMPAEGKANRINNLLMRLLCIDILFDGPNSIHPASTIPLATKHTSQMPSF